MKSAKLETGIRFVLTGFIVLIALAMIGLWAMWMFSPEAAKDFFEVDARSITGINALKSDMGGAVLAIGVFLILSLVKGTQWLYSAAITSGCLMLGRTISLLADGYTQAGVRALIVEVVAVTVFVLVARRYPRHQS